MLKMNLTETSILKKFETDIGNSITDVGGRVSHDIHWIPELDDVIEWQLTSDDPVIDLIKIIDERIDLKFDEMGISSDNVLKWNQSYEDLHGDDGLIKRVEALEQKGDNIWDETSFWKE